MLTIESEEQTDLGITLGILRVLHASLWVEESQRVTKFKELSGVLRMAREHGEVGRKRKICGKVPSTLGRE